MVDILTCMMLWRCVLRFSSISLIIAFLTISDVAMLFDIFYRLADPEQDQDQLIATVLLLVANLREIDTESPNNSPVKSRYHSIRMQLHKSKTIYSSVIERLRNLIQSILSHRETDVFNK